jgi:hypothetical protein
VLASEVTLDDRPVVNPPYHHKARFVVRPANAYATLAISNRLGATQMRSKTIDVCARILQ